MKVLIVDDEAPARERLRQLLAELPEHAVAGEAATGKEAVEQASALRPDVVLLDIRMPGIDGIEAAHHLNRMDHPPAIVFTTAYDRYAIQAFEANAIGYVLKPVRLERLEKALRQAARLDNRSLDTASRQPGVDSRRSHICVPIQDELRLIPVEDISYFHADQKYVRLHCDGDDHLIDESLKSLEREFADSFVRIHRSVLVAIAHIESLQKTRDGQTRVRLQHSDRQPDDLIISRRHLADVRRRLKGA